MRTPNDLKFVNPHREEIKIYSVDGEIFFEAKSHLLIGCLVHLQKNPLHNWPKGGFLLLPDEEWFETRLKACDFINEKLMKLQEAISNVVSKKL